MMIYWEPYGNIQPQKMGRGGEWILLRLEPLHYTYSTNFAKFLGKICQFPISHNIREKRNMISTCDNDKPIHI
jgi:hypothetical protein